MNRSLVDLDFKALVEAAPAAIAVLDADARCLYANAAFEQAFGRPLVDLEGQRPDESLSPADSRTWRRAIADVLRSGASTAIEYTITAPNRARRFAGLLAPLPGQRVCVVSRDVTDLRAGRVLAVAAQTMSTGMVIVEAPTGAVLFQNDEVERLFGKVSRPVEGIESYDAIVAFDRDGRRLANDRWPIARALHGENSVTDELEIHRHDGAWRTISINASPVRDGSGEIVAAVSTYTDVTPIKRAHVAATYLAEAGALLERFDPETTPQAIVDLAVPKLADWCYIHLNTAGHPRIAAIANAEPAAVARARALVAEPQPLSEDTAVARVLAGGPRELVQIDETVLRQAARDEEHLRHLRSRGYTSAVVAPLAGREGVLGAITFSMTDSGRRYTEADLDMLSELARRTGIALENARLFEAEQQARRQAEAARDRTRRLQKLTEALLGAVEKPQVASVMVDAGRAALGAAAGFVWMQRDAETLELVAYDDGGKPGQMDRFATVALNAPIPLCDVIRTGQPVMFENIDAMSARYPAAIRAGETAFRSWAVVPLIVAGVGVGGLSFSFAEERAFSDEDRQLLTAITGQASLAMERALLLESERRARAEADAARMRERQLHHLAARLSRARTPHEVTAISAEEARSVVGAVWAGASIRVGDELHILGVSGSYDPERLAKVARVPLDFAIPAAEAIRSGQVVWAAGEGALAARYPHFEASWRGHGVRSWGAVPFAFEGRSGAISVSFAEARELGATDRDFLRAVGELTAQALERARLYEALQDSEERLRVALSAGRAATWSVDLATMTTTRDPSYLALLDIRDGRGTGDFAMIHPEDRAIAREAYERSLRDAVPYTPEVRMQRGDGAYTWIRAHGRVIAGADGKPATMAGVIVDIDEQKRASLRADEERRINDTLHRLASSFASELDHDRLVQLITDEIGKLVGAEQASFGLGHEPAVPVDAAGSRLSVPVVTRTGEAYGTLSFEHSEPGRFTAAHARLATSIAGQAAVALENARLYKTVREQKDQLEHAVQRARVADRRKDEFLAMLGHELRNPLAPIATALDLMNLKASSALNKEREIIRRQVDHLSRLVDDLLDVSRITRGKIQLVRQVVEMAAVLAKAIEMASPLMEKRQQELSLDVPREGLSVDADPTRLAQVFQNLLTNASKYSEPATLIAVRARADGERIVVTIRDQGIGIPPELLPEVFDVFVQGQRAIDRSEGGLGLGLAIARSICELHGGRIEAASAGPGAGSVLTVTLPAAARVEAAQRTGGTAPIVRTAGAVRVLVVDDNVDAAQTLHEFLGCIGHDSAVAHDGVAALELARSFQPQVALLDIGLPVMDGYELARRLRAQNGGTPLRLIALTGYGQEDDRTRAHEAGFDHHLVKPITLDALMPLLVER
ncbi:MAG: GAF domain-containing protein [Polyangia bacterium]